MCTSLEKNKGVKIIKLYKQDAKTGISGVLELLKALEAM